MAGMKGRPNLPLMAIAILLLCGAVSLHIACMCLPQYAVMDDFVGLLRSSLSVWKTDPVWGRDVNKALMSLNDIKNHPVITSFGMSYGLWEFCFKFMGVKACIDFTRDPLFKKSSDISLLSFQTPTWLYACQLASIAAAVMLGITLVSVIAILVKPRSKVGKPYYAAGFAIFAGIVTLAANLIFITQNSMEFVMESDFLQDQLMKGNKNKITYEDMSEDMRQATVEAYNEHFAMGPMLKANMATPVIAIVVGVLLILVGVWDRRQFELEVYHRDQDEGIKLKG